METDRMKGLETATECATFLDSTKIVESYKLNQWREISSFCFREAFGGKMLELILHDRPRAFNAAIFCIACKTTELGFQQLRDSSSSMDTSIETAGELDVPKHDPRSL